MQRIHITQMGTETYLTKVASGQEIIVSEKGFDPWQALLLSMASCTAITLEMYSARKGWDISGLEIEIERDETITMTLYLPQNLDSLQRERLAQIAQRCPVVKAVREGIQIHEKISAS